MPTISVIVPVYKVEKYIHRCVDSILGQTYTDFELILVDDGSPDNCGAICDEYAAKDSRVVIIHQENGGLSAVRNAGIDWAFANSDSQWLTFIDSDDWVHPEYLQRLLDAAIEFNVSVSICGYAQTEGKEPEIDPETLIPTLWNTEDFYVEHNINATVAWGKLYRKKCFQEIRYPVGKIHEDEFTTYKILFQFLSVAVIQAPLYFYFTNFQSITNSTWTSKRLDAFAALDEQLLYFSKLQNTIVLKERIQTNLLLTHIHISAINKSSYLNASDSEKNIKYLKKRMQRILFKYYSLHAITISSNAWHLEVVFPVLMHIYWIFTNKLKKLSQKSR